MAIQEQFIKFLRLDKLGFRLDAGQSASEGEMVWNADEGTADVGLVGGVTGQMFREAFFYGKNATASIISNGKPVMFAAPVGNSGKSEIKLAIANGSTLSEYIMGITTQDIAVGGFGNVTWFGNVRGINTTGSPYGEVWADGDLIYVSTTVAGGLTNVEPQAPFQRILIASVQSAHSSGTLLLRPTWNPKLTQLDDVNGTPLTVSGQILYWDQTRGVFDFSTNTLANDITFKHGDIALGNYSELEADGSLVAHGDATTWDDVYPASVTVGVGGTAPSFTAYNGGNLKAYEFTGGVTNKQLQIGYQIYHSYKEGSSISPHIHITFTSGAADAGKTIIFTLEYEWQNVEATGAYSTATLTGTHTIAANNTVYRNQIVSFTGTPIDGTGKLISSTFMTLLTRDQATDSFTDSCWLLSADIHIEKDMIGSRQVMVK